ncbi:MAG: restriction endonuclease subunit S [Pseudoxanthomonas sp.]|nr:MAG: restriction endonuclease subunit S [Pseudoxanthomonas sp.]
MSVAIVQLGDVASSIMGQAPEPRLQYGRSRHAFVKAGEFGTSRPVIREWTTRPLKFAKRSDVLLCVVGATCGKINRGEDCAIGRSVAAIRPDPDRLDNEYLYYFLGTWTERLRKRSQGAAQTVITREMVEDLEMPLPPLAEQRRIAAILDKADALRTKRRETIAKLDQLLQSLFSDLFGDPVTNDRAWRDDVKLGDVADIASGITKGRRASGSVRSVPYLAVANVQDRHLRLDSIKSIEATEAEIDRYRLLVNDLVLTEGGDPDKLGRGALWDGSVPDCIHQNHVFRVRVTSKDVDPIFLNWLVGSSRGKRYFLSVAKQTTGIASINMSQLKSFPLLIPPIDLQARFSAMVSAFEKWRFQFGESAKALDHLFESLQQRAFTGKL